MLEYMELANEMGVWKCYVVDKVSSVNLLKPIGYVMQKQV